MGSAGLVNEPQRRSIITPLRDSGHTRISGSKCQFASGTRMAELCPPDVAAHSGQAAVPCVAHDLLVGHAVVVGGCHEASPQSVRRDRLGPGRFRPVPRASAGSGVRLRCSAGWHQPAAAVDLAKQGTRGDLRRRKRRLHGRDRARRVGPAAWSGDLGAFAVLVRLGTLDQELQAFVGLRHLRNV
jgi:hypothetical protein